MEPLNTLSKNAQATLLLTSYFSKMKKGDIKPLSNTEWGRFALWLREQNKSPSDLLMNNPQSLLINWNDRQISTERIIYLLGRGYSLALALEKWQRAGLWVITRSDPEYPKRLKQKLKNNTPPVLFGCGQKKLLNSGGLAVVGSRNASKEDLFFTKQVGIKASSNGVPIVSGGARGIDEVAMLSAASHGGIVLGVIPDNLLKLATSSKWRNGLLNNNIVLLSVNYPEASFSVGNAMARNKYIYCLADSALVVHSGKTGGTLTGAKENLKKNWVPLWVKSTTCTQAANSDLVEIGGCWCSSDSESLTIPELMRTNHKILKKENTYQKNVTSAPIQPELF